MDASLVSIPHEGMALVKDAGAILGVISAYQIHTQEDAGIAVNQTRDIKAMKATIEDYRKSLTKPLDEEKKAIMDYFRPAVDNLDKAEGLLKGVIAAWNAEQQKIAAEQEKVRRAQEAEERKRQEAERETAADLLAQADQAAANGDYAKAEELEAMAAASQSPVISCPVVTAPVKTKGASVSKIWKCRVVDPALVPREWLMPNQGALDAYAKTTKGAGFTIAGCEFYSEDSVSIR